LIQTPSKHRVTLLYILDKNKIKICNTNQIRDPQGIEKISGSLFFFAVVFAKIQKVKDIGMPGLKVDGKCTRTFIATLKKNIVEIIYLKFEINAI